MHCTAAEERVRKAVKGCSHLDFTVVALLTEFRVRWTASAVRDAWSLTRPAKQQQTGHDENSGALL